MSLTAYTDVLVNGMHQRPKIARGLASDSRTDLSSSMIEIRALRNDDPRE